MRRLLPLALVAALALFATTCNRQPRSADSSHSSATRERLQGAGSSFDEPLFSKVFDLLAKEKGIEVNYQPIGSGGGVLQLTKGTVDFAASDFPMNDEQTKAAEASGGPVVHVPVTMGAIAIAYNLPIPDLKLDGDTLSGMYLGTIKTWNDPRVAALNPTVRLPDTPVVVTYRADTSGSTFLLTSYLAAVSASWKMKVGAAGAVAWPVGVGAKGSAGISGVVTSTPGAIGYFELAYAKKNQIRTARLKNSAGHFIEPSPASAAAASDATVANMPADLKAMFVNAPGERSYPIAGFSWVIAFKNQKNALKAREIVALLRFTVTTGQQYAENLDYAPLPARIQALDEGAIQSIVVPSER